jgi:hypothetical protein
MKRVLCFILWPAALVGCASYTQSKIDLTAQAQKGVGLVRQGVMKRSAESERAAAALRERLGAAFDADVVARSSLSADWVVAHRKAYVAALDAFDAQRSDGAAADAATLANLDATSMLLAQLQQMHATELRLTLPSLLPEVKR